MAAILRLMVPCLWIQPTRPALRRARQEVQMAEEVQTTKKDNEPVRIAVWYDYI